MRTDIDPRLIDWQAVCLNLRQHYKPLAAIGREVGAEPATLRRLARGETRRVELVTGLYLLDLHLYYCPEQHGPAILRGDG